ncbi:FtsX-like permease family protein [Actinocrispum wychmicini]|uniref:Putative lysophospholipase L1 biosynthesis ABC-type transport system permease subunit n=1 Tax=Actinocrispum wychmicini TaxID=1213861 RepID=A0A4R2IVS8_9PSEU|nr:FtsX-like permease family protein [Actinocrispum wychmicini]TCO48872.1 putative lysophospholipase L1 biosynthesis ABC-type transport system permease subunit [Actinocrispum wychmicini]
MNPVQLAWRVLRGDARSRVSALFTAIGVAVGVTLVLWLAAVPGALQQRADRQGWQEGNFVQEEGSGAVLVNMTRDNVGAQRIERFDVAALRPDVPLAAGIPKVPGPGEVILSPALAKLAASLPADQLADRFKGTVVAQFGDAALTYPDELVAMVGHDKAELPNGMEWSGFTGAGRGYINKLLVILSQIGLVVLIAPCLVLVASAARLTAARRERRLAALRLAGATPQQVVSMTAAETAIASVVGAVLGVGLSFPLRWLVAKIPWDGGTWFPSDWTPTPLMIVAVLVVAPLLVVGAAVLGLRRAVRTPLGAAQQQTRRQPNTARLLWLGGAAVAFIIAIQLARDSRGDSGMTFVLLGLGAVAVSLIFVGPLVTSLLGKVFVTRWRSPSTLLAGRRLRDDPKAAFRASAGVVLAVFAGSLALAMFPSVESQIGHSTGQWRDGVYVASSSATTEQQLADLRSDLQRRNIQAPVVPIVDGAVGTGDKNRQSAMVISCTDAAKVLGGKFPACRPGPAIYVPRSTALDPTRLKFSANQRHATDVPLPPGISVREYEPSGRSYGVLIDPGVLPQVTGATTVAVVATPKDQEVVHTLLVRNLPGVSLYSNERYDARADTLSGDLRRATLIGLSIATVLGGVSAGVAAAGSVVDRRRTFGALIAAGTPVKVLTKALRREAMLPALIATVGAGVAGVLVGSGLLTLVAGRLQLSVWIVTPIVLGLVVALIAAAACGPVLRKVTARDYSDE